MLAQTLLQSVPDRTPAIEARKEQIMPDEPLAQEIAAYQRMLPELQEHHLGKFVVFHGEDFAGVWDTLDAAATEAVRRFGRGPFLIRQVGAPPMTLPASVCMRVVEYANA